MSFCRSYGSVFKAHYKETGEIVAIKQVPVESDLQEIIKEISIMQQCNRYMQNENTLLCKHTNSSTYLFFSI